MATTIVVLRTPKLEEPKWAQTEAKPGEEVTLSVKPESLSGQAVAFEIRDPSNRLMARLNADGAYTAKWTVPMIADTTADGVDYRFFAILREKPAALNGHLGVVQSLPSTNALKVKGTRITIEKMDEFFVPKQENLEVKFKVEGQAPVNGYIEVWGERYPTDKPLYTKEFTYNADEFVPASGVVTWKTWDGKPSDTKTYLNCKTAADKQYLTPEFSPYRVRIVVGPDAASVKDPFGAGLGKVALAERQFEVTIESIQIRLMNGLNERVAADVATRQYKLENVLKIGEPAANGTYPGGGRLPCKNTWQANFRVDTDGKEEFDISTFDANFKYKFGGNELTLWLNDKKLTKDTDYEEVDPQLLTKLAFKIKLKPTVAKAKDMLWIMRHDPDSLADDQVARIRVPMARHNLRTDQMDMGEAGGRVLADSYMAGGAAIKYDLDKPVYSRPQIPLEFVPKFTSRDSTKNATPHFGLIEPTVSGPVRMEPVAEDNYVATLYTAGHATHQAYFKNAHHKVKRGTDTTPQKNSAAKKPIFSFWQWRQVIAADVTVDTEYDFSTFDPTMQYKSGAATPELTVWLNRTQLAKDIDYEEVAGAQSTKFKLKKDRAKAKDVLWVVRNDSAATGTDKVDGWERSPAGTNCHIYYGGLRGADPSDAALRLFRKDFTPTQPSPREPIIGSSDDAYPYKDNDYIQLAPDPVDPDKQERVEVAALLPEGKQQGVAGIIFSPSCIGSDSYVLKVRLTGQPYDRNFGEVSQKAYREAKTGTLTVWRWMQLAKSFRCPNKEIGALRNGIGSDPEPDIAGRAYKGDGKNVNLAEMNTDMFARAYNEWTVPLPLPITGASFSGTDPIEITTAVPHGMNTGDKAEIVGVDGNTNANGTWTITKTSDTKFTLDGRAGNAAYTVGGTAEPVEIHTDMDLETYVVQHDTKAGTMGEGKVLIRNDRIMQIKKAFNLSPIVIELYSRHRLQVGDRVTISGVLGLTNANGTHKVQQVMTDYKFRLQGVNGNANHTGGGTVKFEPPLPVAINGATKANPIQITTADPHKFNTRERVTITGVTGNAQANGNHVITKVDANNFTLNGVKGTADYTGGGTVVSRDLHHRNIMNWFVQYDSYREMLPPGTAANRKKIATKAVRMLTPGDELDLAKKLIDELKATLMPLGPDPTAITGSPIPPSPSTYDGQKYFWWAHGNYWMPISEAIVDHFTPREATKPKVMNLVRWPYLHDIYYDLTWQGQCLGDGQSLIHSEPDETTLFSHEMGHSMNLVHFLGGNFGWKHHDLSFPQCMMSYDYLTHDLAKPPGAVGTDGDAFENGGWPDTSGSGGRVKNYRKLEDPPKINLAEPCARCMLKLQGWKEDVLPVAWFHPDLF